MITKPCVGMLNGELDILGLLGCGLVVLEELGCRLLESSESTLVESLDMSSSSSS